ncbi:23S rRNA (adenine(2030)-N(6))-methyltransferase RlmJ [Methylophaga sp.]|uniref:23S rRNA (adenine(2030)-N(6))-methyltransferase RlmJ n=1 Tax=Methylophaga sp. TaxID=2024840 RepID=UPI002723BB2C|nr:23S rRNA (adenine(2030)-N(6))-methyltransferase RlmJ [Methylophaga sp.]MDO8827524.1 23S rRNA (adenine(2030)-N(6))-methyltransferase RlmJ [Methylophaga sp.]
MLSYRHSFHAGNFADVLKHIVLIEILQHLGKKEKAFDYIDTHAGAGLYHLASAHAEKLREYQNGIAKLNPADWPELATYFAVIDAVNSGKTLEYYPGSPFVALHCMRHQDRAWLYELHPEDAGLLLQNTQKVKRARVMREDGLKGLLSLLPPVSRRSLVLIDPSYEIKSDYDLVFQTVEKAYAKFPTGSYAIWYPVVERSRVIRLEKQFIKSGIKNIQRFELAVTADSEQRGMTASGMIVINPPWQLMETMNQLLPKLTNTLAVDSGAFYKAEVLVAE